MRYRPAFGKDTSASKKYGRLSLIKPTNTKYYTKSQSLRKKHVIPLDDVRRRNRPVMSALKAAETETPYDIVKKIEDTESLRTIMQ